MFEVPEKLPISPIEMRIGGIQNSDMTMDSRAR
jgi:hypothetical protein